MKTSLVAACALSFVAGSAAFMAPSPSITRSAFAPAVGVQSRSKVMNAAPVKAGRIALRPRGAASGISKLHMGKVKAEYIWIGGRGGVGDDYRYVCHSILLSLRAKDDLHRDLHRTCLRITCSCFGPKTWLCGCPTVPIACNSARIPHRVASLRLTRKSG
jgi:hypothetical protein